MHFFRWFKKDDRIDHPKKTTEAVVTCSSDFERKDVIKESKDSLWDGITKSVMTQPGDVIERLRYSQSNLKDIVADSQQCDQKAYDTAKNAIEKFGSSYYSKVELETLISILNTDLTQGLTPEQVEVSRQKYGSNVLEKQRSKPWIKTFLETFYSGVVILLLVAGVISLVFQDWYQAAAIFLIVGFNSILSTYMETSAGNALSRLANLSAPRCVVIRDKGQRQTISTVDVVVGDIVYLSTGDVIPADLRCFNVTELEVNEAILTGN
jgi:magnesium-transporting ATPase (P-type)